MAGSHPPNDPSDDHPDPAPGHAGDNRPSGSGDVRTGQRASASGKPLPAVLFDKLPLPEARWLASALRDETIGGAILLVAAALGLLWASSPWSASYLDLSSTKIGPEVLNLNLSLATWAADGLLAIFFFVAGLELKHELVLGTLSKPAQAVVPVAAAIGGMVVPAALFVAMDAATSGGVAKGWGIPMATDIAFALAVLAVIGRRLPVTMRAFLLTLAVVDDLGAIMVIAVFYSVKVIAWPLVAAAVCMLVYFLLQRARVRSAWIYVPLALLTWGLVHEGGVHATVAGVALGLLTRVKPDPGESQAPSERMEHLVRPVSVAIAVPAFAFFAAGVDITSDGIVAALTSPLALAVMVGLVVGKPIGVLGTAWLTARFTRASLSSTLRWGDVAAVGFLAGIGFTVSLLIAGLAFAGDADLLTDARLAVLVGSLLSAVLATVAMLQRNRRHAALGAAQEDTDDDSAAAAPGAGTDAASPHGPQHG